MIFIKIFPAMVKNSLTYRNMVKENDHQKYRHYLQVKLINVNSFQVKNIILKLKPNYRSS